MGDKSKAQTVIRAQSLVLSYVEELSPKTQELLRRLIREEVVKALDKQTESVVE